MQQATEDVPTGDEWLTAAECVALDGLVFEPRRRDWRAGRWVGKAAVAAWLRERGWCLTPHDVEILVADDGGPEVRVPGVSDPPGISLSHGDGVAVCTVAPAKRAVGCDIETVADHSGAFTARYMTVTEQRWLANAGPVDRARLSTLLWCAKESALKAIREGLRLEPRTVEVKRPQSEYSPGVVGWGEVVVEARKPTRRRFDGWWQEECNRMTVIIADEGESSPRQPPRRLGCRGGT